MLAHGEKRPMLVFAALAFSIFALIPLAFIFDGCTSTSSPSSFYFMKVNLTGFPELKALHIRRSISVSGISNSNLADDTADMAGTATKILASSVAQATSATGNEVDEAMERAQYLTEHLKTHLPTAYIVGLRSYCQANRGSTSSNCSRVSNSFSFDLSSLLGPVSNEIDTLLSIDLKRVLKAYHGASHFSVLAYIIGTTTTAIAIALEAMWMVSQWKRIVGTPTASWWLRLVTVSLSSVSPTIAKVKIYILMKTQLASVFLVCASATITAIHVSIKSAIQDSLQSLGAHASLGGLLVAAWFVVLLSVSASFMLWFTRLP
ncbi:unnamed protein product [Penicillium nalgiovense]|nr:unnamed protein product [Penicillium nalgiovense]